MGFYCYAAIMHHRFNKTPFNEIKVLPDQMYIPSSKKPRKIFVGSMSDICYWPLSTIDDLICLMERNINDTFMLLTKSPSIYTYPGHKWQKNVICGTTVTFYKAEESEKLLNQALEAPRPFLSIEPLLGCVHKFDYSKFEVVIVGKDNTRGAKPPNPEWIQSVKDNIPKEKTWWK